MKVNELSTLEIAEIAPGGKALARVEGRVVFVDRGLPGDVVEARITRSKRGWAEARLERVTRSSPLRVDAPCPHFRSGICGGCRFQDLAYPAQLVEKERQVREVLEHLGGVESPLVRPIVAAPERYHYRNKMEFSFHPDPAGAVLGLHVRGEFDRVFQLETCLLPSELTVEVVRFTQAFARTHAWPAYHPRWHSGIVRYLTVRHLPHTAQCAVHLIATSGPLDGLDAWARGVAALSPEVRTVTLVINDTQASIAFGQEERVLYGDGVIVERLLGLEFEATANAFLQTNSRQAEALYTAALDAAEIAPHESVLDLYCGTGTLTLLFARHAARVVGVESVPESVSHARRNAERNGIGNAVFEEGESRRVLREWAEGRRVSPFGAGARPDVVVVDPPRAGLHPRVVFRAAELGPRRIVYVSCNPATLARDVKDFAGHGYRLRDTAPFDLFPHTPHIECVARLEPSG